MASTPPNALRFRSPTTEAMHGVRELLAALPIAPKVEGQIGDIADGDTLHEMSLEELCTVLRQMLENDENTVSADGMPFEYVVERWSPTSPVLSITTKIQGPRNSGSISYASCVQRLAPDRYCLLDSHSE